MAVDAVTTVILEPPARPPPPPPSVPRKKTLPPASSARRRPTMMKSRPPPGRGLAGAGAVAKGELPPRTWVQKKCGVIVAIGTQIVPLFLRCDPDRHQHSADRRRS